LLGDPPWETVKAQSGDFFGAADASYLELGARDGARTAGRPFAKRGTGDLNGYKLFLELGLSLLRQGGRLGMIVPDGLYCDLGTRDLRRLLLDREPLEKLAQSSTPLVDAPGWDMRFSTELHMSSDASRFLGVDAAEGRGFVRGASRIRARSSAWSRCSTASPSIGRFGCDWVASTCRAS